MVGDRLSFSLLLMEAIAPQPPPENACGWLQLWRRWAIAIALVLVLHGVVALLVLLVKDLARAAGQENIHLHRRRHTIASRLIEDGMDGYITMQLTRHRSVQDFKSYSNKVRYHATKSAYWKGQGEQGREVQSLEELLEWRR
jgi:integrase